MRAAALWAAALLTVLSSALLLQTTLLLPVATQASANFVQQQRKYQQKLRDGVTSMTRGGRGGLRFMQLFSVHAKAVRMPLQPTPKDILRRLCEDLLPDDVVAVLYLTNSAVFGSNAASVQYVLQLLGYLGVPVIAWNADNIALDQRASQARVLQLAPSVVHQVAAIFAILERYSWYQFAVITTNLGGHEDFVRAVRDRQLESSSLRANPGGPHLPWPYSPRVPPAARNPSLPGKPACSSSSPAKDDSRELFAAASQLGMTGKNYVWIVTQSVIGAHPGVAPPEYPAGLLGIHYNTSLAKLHDEIERAVLVLGHGLELFVNEPSNVNVTLAPGLRCYEPGRAHWEQGGHILPLPAKDTGTELEAGLKRVSTSRISSGLGEELVPPKGVPEKFNLKVTFMEERPFLNIGQPDNETGECESGRAVKCRVVPEAMLQGINDTAARKNSTFYKCCLGFCIDLLQKFAQDLGFTYDIHRVEDGTWGVKDNGTWNGLIAELLEGKADIVVTSIKINSDRQMAVDFTVPFLETGIAIVVAKRTGIISPKAFLEPFDTVSWLLILLVSIQVAAFSIFVFEWMSPSGYDMRITPPREHRFSLFRTYWLVWAILFGAAVNVDCPRGYTARFMSNVWAMFAVVFLAIYTANLAAFMITREEYYNLVGIEDHRLQNPQQVEPPFRFGTIPHGNTEAVLKQNKPKMYSYMRQFNRSTVLEGIRAVKRGELDAFVYDATVLDYLVGQDDECRLLTVGSWYAMTGYGFALPKKSKYLQMFNRQMIEYRERGDLERLQRFWLQGACKPDKAKRNASNPLDVNQFMSAFLLLGCGVLLTLLLLLLEHLYFRYLRARVASGSRGPSGRWLALISLSMGKSLSFRDAVYEARKRRRCRDPVCDTQLWKVRHELDMARMRVSQLETQLGIHRPPSTVQDLLRSREGTNNRVTPSDSRGGPVALIQREITEKETVL
ncbi:hypothetical protein MTO96_039792 [Rhipicephalus appendiculatus]